MSRAVRRRTEKPARSGLSGSGGEPGQRAMSGQNWPASQPARRSGWAGGEQPADDPSIALPYSFRRRKPPLPAHKIPSFPARRPLLFSLLFFSFFFISDCFFLSWSSLWSVLSCLVWKEYTLVFSLVIVLDFFIHTSPLSSFFPLQF